MDSGIAFRSEALDTKTVLILFVEIVIIAIYLICLLLVIIRRARKLIDCKNRKYYAAVVFYVLSKMIVSAIIVIQIIVGISTGWENLSPSHIELLIKTAIVLADFSVVELFLISLQAYFKLYLSALNDSPSKVTALPSRNSLRSSPSSSGQPS